MRANTTGYTTLGDDGVIHMPGASGAIGTPTCPETAPARTVAGTAASKGSKGAAVTNVPAKHASSPGGVMASRGDYGGSDRSGGTRNSRQELSAQGVVEEVSRQLVSERRVRWEAYLYAWLGVLLCPSMVSKELDLVSNTCTTLSCELTAQHTIGVGGRGPNEAQEP